jgi:HAD superfamily hydrolase (TIGR01509 family)
MIKGILFDVDGTLVDSNDAHAQAWVEAFAAHGHEVAFEDIRKLIGMGGDKLLLAINPKLSGTEGTGKAISDSRQKIFLEKYAASLQPTPGSRELVGAVISVGIRTMVASSAKSEELEHLLAAAGVADLLTDATTSDDVEKSKPDPDIVTTAVAKIGLPADEVVMLGDTPYDIEASLKAGVPCIALRSGGWDDEDLRGAIAIYDNPADVLAHRGDFGY